MSTGNLHNAMRSLTAATLIALSAVTLSCTKTQIEPETPKGPAIEFSTKDPWTKATDGTDEVAKDAMRKSGFNVWGWFRGTTNGHVFNATKVHDATYNSETGSFSSTTPNWTYAPESPRYWMNGLYDFAAVYPTTVAGTYAPAQPGEDPILTISNFDVTKQDDLLVAFYTGIDGGNHPDEVALTFQHALASLNVQLHVAQETIDGIHVNVIEAEVREVSFKGISKKADYIGDDWANHSTETIDVGKILSTRVALTGEYQTILDEGLLAIPQTMNDGVSLYILADITLPTGQKLQKSWDFPLSGIEECPEWEKNKKYIYKAILTAEADIEFEEPIVQPWIQGESTGVIIPR